MLTILTFRADFDFSRPTENKLRWHDSVEGTNFELYIPKWRVPQPTPPVISVKIYDMSGIDPMQQLSPVQRRDLIANGLTQLEIDEVAAWLPATPRSEEHSDRPIVAAVYVDDDRDHRSVVRYSPIGEKPEVGQPYIPKSALPTRYPPKLILRVTWCY